jgi:PAS domain S-box-containing protein
VLEAHLVIPESLQALYIADPQGKILATGLRDDDPAKLVEAEEAKDRLELILRSVADALIFADMDGRILLLSTSAENFLGRAQVQARGWRLSDLADNPALDEHLGLLLEYHHQTAQNECTFTADPSDKGRTFQVSSTLVKSRDGLADGVITLFHDVSRERELDRMKSEFISTAAHELRTPLTVVLGFSELLERETGLDPKHREYLEIIVEKAWTLQRLIDDLLDLGRVDSGKLVHLEKERCDLRAVLARVLGDFRLTCPNHRFESFPPEHPVELLADPLRLAQVMENLLGNAVKFSAPGSLIRVVCEIRTSTVQITVEDQ